VFAEVAIPRSSPDPLTYRVPAELERFASPGVRVRVPVRKRMATGVLVATSPDTDLDPSIVRPISEVLDPEPLLPLHLLELAAFISSYYRCPLGATLGVMLPSGLLRTDSEEIRLTRAGAAADDAALPPGRAAVLAALREQPRIRLTTLLARSGATGREPVDALVEAGLATLTRRRRDHAPRTDVGAVRLAERPLEDMLAECRRAPRQRAVVQWLAEQGRPVLLSEVQAAVGCSAATVRALAERGLVARFSQRPQPRPRWALRPTEEPISLTDEQETAVSAVRPAVTGGRYAAFLLVGVTGSGKTEVYLRCLETALESGRSGLVLVPEIGLTPAASGAVERRFRGRVAVLHSAQSEGERYREWQRVQEGEARIVVGPRSALFSPLTDVGLVVVDEEHDAAYKQQEAPRYQARDLALVLGQRLGAPVLLCSATPSVEAAALVLRERATELRLTRRVAGGTLPEVELVDLRAEAGEPGEQGRTLFSRRLRERLGDALEAGDQAILLMQRRGWAPVLLCRDCGTRIQCPSCSVSMVVHRASHRLRCHYCGHHQRLPEACPACSGRLLDAVGAGTEKVVHRLQELFPDVRAAVLDRDTIRRRDGLARTLGAFASGEVQVLVGTQMVAKGHHFPNVTLTGVISADAMLGLPDFRSGERTFQLLTQLAGRSGRGEKAGRVVIQTYYPDHPAVLHACRHDTASFLAEELTYRRAFAYPPVVRMAVVRFEARAADLARRAAEEAARKAQPLPPGVRLRGPAPAPLERIREHWRWQLLISAPDRELLRATLAAVESAPMAAQVRRVIDVDPLSTL